MSVSFFSVHFPLRVESSTQWSNPQNDFQHHSLLVVVAISVVVVVVVLFAVAALLYFVFLLLSFCCFLFNYAIVIIIFGFCAHLLNFRTCGNAGNYCIKYAIIFVHCETWNISRPNVSQSLKRKNEKFNLWFSFEALGKTIYHFKLYNEVDEICFWSAHPI